MLDKTSLKLHVFLGEHTIGYVGRHQQEPIYLSNAFQNGWKTISSVQAQHLIELRSDPNYPDDLPNKVVQCLTCDQWLTNMLN